MNDPPEAQRVGEGIRDVVGVGDLLLEDFTARNLSNVSEQDSTQREIADSANSRLDGGDRLGLSETGRGLASREDSRRVPRENGAYLEFAENVREGEGAEQMSPSRGPSISQDAQHRTEGKLHGEGGPSDSHPDGRIRPSLRGQESVGSARAFAADSGGASLGGSVGGSVSAGGSDRAQRIRQSPLRGQGPRDARVSDPDSRGRDSIERDSMGSRPLSWAAGVDVGAEAGGVVVGGGGGEAGGRGRGQEKSGRERSQKSPESLSGHEATKPFRAGAVLTLRSGTGPISPSPEDLDSGGVQSGALRSEGLQFGGPHPEGLHSGEVSAAPSAAALAASSAALATERRDSRAARNGVFLGRPETDGPETPHTPERGHTLGDRKSPRGVGVGVGGDEEWSGRERRKSVDDEQTVRGGETWKRADQGEVPPFRSNYKDEEAYVLERIADMNRVRRPPRPVTALAGHPHHPTLAAALHQDIHGRDQGHGHGHGGDGNDGRGEGGDRAYGHNHDHGHNADLNGGGEGTVRAGAPNFWHRVWRKVTWRGSREKDYERERDRGEGRGGKGPLDSRGTGLPGGHQGREERTGRGKGGTLPHGGSGAESQRNMHSASMPIKGPTSQGGTTGPSSLPACVCILCGDMLQFPARLPCGDLGCLECVFLASYDSTLHECPRCREPLGKKIVSLEDLVVAELLNKKIENSRHQLFLKSRKSRQNNTGLKSHSQRWRHVFQKRKNSV